METMLSAKGKILIIIDNYKYRKKKVLKRTGETYWCCTVKDCLAKAYTVGMGKELTFSRKSGDHDHVPPTNEQLNKQVINNAAKGKIARLPRVVIHEQIKDHPHVTESLLDLEELFNFFTDSDTPITQLINQAKELIDKLSMLKLETITNSNTKLEDYIQLINKLKEEYIQQGTDGILNKISNAVPKIETFIERSKEISNVLNIDISDCIDGRKQEMEILGDNLINIFINKISDVINNAVDTINKNKEVVSSIAEEINGLSTKFSNSLLSLNPAPLINEFIAYVKELISEIPIKLSTSIADIVNLINNLPAELLICITEIVEKAEKEVNVILQNIASSIGMKFGNAAIDYLLVK